ncbi:MAG: MarR family transcriptional regulator [Rhodospirillaceae bacterium]|nr:MarR family transcriptional regulator [Rhodospirillaceae bacterium]
MALPDLSEEERALLRALTATPIQARTIARKLNFAQSTLFRCLVALEDAGLIRVQTDDDPLRRHIMLTQAGSAFKADL